MREGSRRDAGAAGTVSVMVPRFRGKMGRELCRFLRVRPDLSINLDAYGTFIWLCIDGRSSVRQIAAELGKEFGKEVEPLHGRLAYFLSLLERNALITYRGRERPARRKAQGKKPENA